MATNFDLINSALTRTGNDPITSYEDGTTEATIAAQNYDQIVEAELSGYRWKWASSEVVLNHLEDEARLPWTDAWQLPNDVLLLRTVTVDGLPISYERKFNKILCLYDEESELVAHYTWSVPETHWPGWFKELIIRRLEAVFLRAIAERYDDAERREKAADDQQMKARLLDAQSEPPKNPHKSKILAARGGSSNGS